MTRKRRFGTAMFVAVVGSFVSGCCALGTADKNEGRFCASPVEGGQYCVPVSDGPAAAWEDAKAAGNEPIQMWAVWPENLELEEVVAHPNLLNSWLDDVREVLFYLRVNQGNAESYHASLSGKQRDHLQRARSLQSATMADKSMDPQGLLLGPLTDKLPAEIEPLKLQIAADKQTMGEIQTLVEQSRIDGAPFAASYETLVDDFIAYRATEADELAEYRRNSHKILATVRHACSSFGRGGIHENA